MVDNLNVSAGDALENKKFNARGCAFNCDTCKTLCACAVCNQTGCENCVCANCVDDCSECECSICEETTCIGCKNIPECKSIAVCEETTAEEVVEEVAEETTAEEVVEEVTEETTAEEEVEEVAEETTAEEVVEEVAEETTAEEVVEEVAEETTAEEVVEEVAEETTAEEEVEEVAEETTAEEVVEEVAEETTAEEVVEEVAEETTAEEVVEEVAEETTAEEVVEEVTEETTAEEVVEEVAEETTAEEVVEEPAKESVEECGQAEQEVAVAEGDEAGPEVSPEEEAMFAEEDDEPEAPDPEEASKEERKRMVEEIKLQLAIPPRRRYIAAPSEKAEIDDEYTVEIPNRSEMKENVQSVFKALIKEGFKLGYLDKYDGLSASEIKEEYEGELVYEVADQELRKVALKVCEVKKEQKVGVYAFSWDGTDVHHIGYLNEPEKANALIPYLNDKDNYIFNVCGIITGGKFKSVESDPKSGKIKIKNCEGLPYGLELDIAIYKKN